VRSLAGLPILCIDNEPQVLDGMEVLLGGWGCHVTAAADLAGAIDAIEKGPRPAGILVDYHLDRANGVDVVRELRARYGDLPAILITADRSPEVRDEARNAGIHLLHKPVKPASLRALLGGWRVSRIAAAE
jgi:CheY-like chemotaxis protein